MMCKLYVLICVLIFSVIGFTEITADVLPVFGVRLHSTAFCQDKSNSQDGCKGFFAKNAPITKNLEFFGGLELYLNGKSCGKESCTVFLMYTDYESTSFLNVPRGTIVWDNSYRSSDEVFERLEKTREAKEDRVDFPPLPEHTPETFYVDTGEECKPMWKWDGTKYDQEEGCADE